MIPTHSRRYLARALPMLLWSACCLAQAPAQTQPAAGNRRPDPLDPKAAVPALRYESAMAQYRRLGDDKPVPWREANDTVARIGGWRVYAREAQQADPAAAPPPPAATAPAAASPTAAPADAASPNAASPNAASPIARPAGALPAATPASSARHGGHSQP